MKNIEKHWEQVSNEMQSKGFSGKTFTGDRKNKALLISQMRKKIKLGIGWTVFFLLLLIALALSHLGSPQILLIISFGVMLMGLNLLASINYYQKIKSQPRVASNSKTMLVDYYNWVVKILRMERIWSQFAIPCFLVLSLIYSQLQSHGSFAQLVFDSRMIIIAGLLMGVVVPLVILWVNWSQKYAFKNDLLELRAAIDDLEGEEGGLK
jgi:hypothetical protein